MAYYLQNPRMAWTDEEDQCLRAAVARYGVKRWAQISALLPGRTSKACSHRWRTYLQPGVMHTSTNPFTDWEVAVVKEAHRALGNNWSAIARMLPGRTNAAVKNFWYAHKRRSQRARGRGPTRRSDAADNSAPSAAGDADDEDFCGADLDADLDFADMDDGDVDLDFGDDGDIACEDLDEDEELLQDEATDADEHLVEGAAMHAGAYDVNGLPVGSWAPSEGPPPPAPYQHQQPSLKQDCEADAAGYMSIPAVLSSHENPQQSQGAAAGDSTHTSPTTLHQRTVDGKPVNTPGHNSSTGNSTWSAQQHMQQAQTVRPGDNPGSPAAPPTRESAAGAPPGTVSVGVYLGSPVVPPNGHSCAGTPPGTGSATETTYMASPVVAPFGPSAGAFALATDPGNQARLSSGQLMMGALGDLGVGDDPTLPDITGSEGMNNDLLLMRAHSDCLVDLNGPGVSASHCTLLDDQLLPFSSIKASVTCMPDKQLQKPESNYCYQTHISLAAAPGQIAAQPTIAGISLAGSPMASSGMQREDFGVAQLADFPQLQLQVGQKRRVSYMHGYASQIAEHSRSYANSVPITAGNGHAALVMHTASNYSSSSNSSSWLVGVQQQEQMMSRQSYCSDSGVCSSGQDSVLPGALFYQQQHHPQQQQPFAYPGDQASRFLRQQQQQQQPQQLQHSWPNASNTHGNVTTITTAAVPAPHPHEVVQQQQQKQQRPQQAAKRFCLDLSDEALAAEHPMNKH